MHKVHPHVHTKCSPIDIFTTHAVTFRAATLLIFALVALPLLSIGLLASFFYARYRARRRTAEQAPFFFLPFCFAFCP